MVIRDDFGDMPVEQAGWYAAQYRSVAEDREATSAARLRALERLRALGERFGSVVGVDGSEGIEVGGSESVPAGGGRLDRGGNRVDRKKLTERDVLRRHYGESFWEEVDAVDTGEAG